MSEKNEITGGESTCYIDVIRLLTISVRQIELKGESEI